MILYNLVSNLNICLKKNKVVLLEKESKFVKKLLDAFWNAKIIVGYQILNQGFIKIFLKYKYWGKPLIKKISIISKPGKRVYKRIYELKKIQGNSLLFLNTSKGILSHKVALYNKIGGEALVKIDI